MQFINMFVAAGVSTSSKSEGNILVFRESGKREMWIVTWLVSALAVLVIIGLNSIQDYLIHISALLFFILIVLTVVSMETIIEINRAAGTVRRTSRLFFRSNERIYRIEDFSAVTIMEKPVEIGEGNLCIRYSVVLTGNGRSLEIFSSEDRNITENHQKEISLFLGLPFH